MLKETGCTFFFPEVTKGMADGRNEEHQSLLVLLHLTTAAPRAGAHSTLNFITASISK